MRKMIGRIVGDAPDLNVVGYARDGAEAVAKVSELDPDVVTMDVEMPVLDGVGALKQIMHTRPTAVVMLSSETQSGAETTLKCLDLGAVDFVGKPSGSISLDIQKIGGELVTKIRMASKVRPNHFRSHPAVVHQEAPAAIIAPPVDRGLRTHSSPHVLVIGASTGGPRALQAIVPRIPKDIGIPVVIVQHMPPTFTSSLAKRLNSDSAISVCEASNGSKLTPGLALVAPGGFHMEFDSNGVARLTLDPPMHGVRPAVDVTVNSLVRIFGAHTLAVLLTGMGHDGARGLKAVHDCGGQTMAEDESTCVVYGMPKSAVEMGAVDRLLPLPQLASAVVEALERVQLHRAA
jgi:two-component system chemotaxis response regulator CheB